MDLINLISGGLLVKIVLSLVVGFLIIKVLKNIASIFIKIAIGILALALAFVIFTSGAIPIMNVSGTNLGQPVGMQQGIAFSEYFLLENQKPLFEAALSNCYLGEKSYNSTLAFTQDLRDRYSADEISNIQMWKELSSFNKMFTTELQSVDEDCISQEEIEGKIKQLQDVERSISYKYYSQFNKYALFYEKIKTWIAFRFILPRQIPFKVRYS